VPPDRRAARRDALLDLLQRQELDGLVVTHLPNVRYLTGFTGSAGLAVVLRQETIFVSDFRYRTQADSEVAEVARIEITPADRWERVRQLLGEYGGVGAVGFESQTVTVDEASRMERGNGRTAFRATQGLVERLRASKDSAEVEAIRRAAHLAHEALDATLETVRAGQLERDVAVVLEGELRRRGSEWHPFPTIVASGPRSALPHARTADREIARGDLLLLDFGAQVDGYCADITRTVVVGEAPDERQRTIYELVREAQLAARERIRPGMTGKEADALARSVIDARGFGEAFGHSLGHGLGLEVHEGPRLSTLNEDPLPDDAVVTIEPGVYVAGWGGVRIEDDIVLRSGGAELLSRGDTQLRVLA
jgi:Xaa-Pro aminopeptidase